MSDTIIRTSQHSLLFANNHKLEELCSFITEYRRVAQLYLNHLWEKGITLTTYKNNKTTYYNFDTNTNLNCPTMLSTVELDKELNLQSTLTARVKKCCVTQILSVIRGTIEKQKRRQYIVNKKRSQSKSITKKLRKAVRKNKPTKPDVSRINPEINSVCLDYQDNNNSVYDGWLKLFSYTNTERSKSVLFPIKDHRHSKKLAMNGTRMNSFILTDKAVDIRWEVKPTTNISTSIVGADQGKTTILSLSDKQETPLENKDGYSLDKIMDVLSRKKKGSKKFKKAQNHRRNFINWSINQLNFSNIGTLKFEDVKYLRYKNSSGRKMSHWTYSDIRDKVESRCELENVSLIYDSSTYYSQRCHICGLVLKSQRKRKVYTCTNCGWEGDSDYNSACNHQQDLPDISDLRRLNLNKRGFFWRTSGLTDLTGEEFTVPLSKELG